MVWTEQDPESESDSWDGEGALIYMDAIHAWYKKVRQR